MLIDSTKPDRPRFESNRRSSISKIANVFAFGTAQSSALLGLNIQSVQAQTGVSAKSSAISQLAKEFLERTGIPGLSFAFSRLGQIVHQEALGFANLERKERLSVDHSFRIASVSKPITAAVVFALIERGKIKLSDRVFGSQALLGLTAAGQQATLGITLQHLLSHGSGGWGSRSNDPMFMHNSLSHAELIDWTLKNLPLTRAPGSSYEYSNFGYCLLGRIIEKVTGKPYAEASKELILSRAGISKMHIAGNGPSQRASNEVSYYMERSENAYAINVTRMDAHGGWVATPSDLVKFAASVDGHRPNSNILHGASIEAMTRPSSVNPGYASGWSVNNAPNWWHSGSLAGTTSLMVRTATGMCWAACCNARTVDSVAALDDLMWKIARTVPAWQA